MRRQGGGREAPLRYASLPPPLKTPLCALNSNSGVGHFWMHMAGQNSVPIDKEEYDSREAAEAALGAIRAECAARRAELDAARAELGRMEDELAKLQ